ncbi:MAG: ABC transporter permease subunit [Oscillospiraceae bacterium]|jgi:putative aldouronate transport system permease protein|nr:ABC transporter permease subunit [Oscillospiraceae bacterium]
MRLRDIKKDWVINRAVYFMALPMLIYFIIFNWLPIGGMMLAFEEYSSRGGTLGSQWIGFQNFINFFASSYIGRLFKNTIIISLMSMAVNFPAPIILALLLNEMENQIYKKVIQTVSYMPYFVSTVVICGIIKDFVAIDGPITHALVNMGVITKAQDLLASGLAFRFFRPIFVISGAWQGTGYGSIIFLAMLSSVDQELYEAAKIDGAGRWKQTLHVTIPGILPIIMLMLIMQVSSLLNVAMEKILLLYDATNYEVSDVIMTFVYRKGLQDGVQGLSTAVQIFNSLISMALLFISNAVSRKVSDFSLF